MFFLILDFMILYALSQYVTILYNDILLLYFVLYIYIHHIIYWILSFNMLFSSFYISSYFIYIMLYYSFSIVNILYYTIYIYYINKWGWRPHAADPWDQLAHTVSRGRWVRHGGAGVVAELKHHGSEGQIRPAARSPECQTSLSEPTRN